MIISDLTKLVNLLDSENKLLKNDLTVYQKTMQNILSLPTVNIDGHNVISMDQVIKICEENFKYLSSKMKENKK